MRWVDTQPLRIMTLVTPDDLSLLAIGDPFERP